MALGTDLIFGHVDFKDDTETGSIAKKITDRVNSYTNQGDDVIEMNTVMYGSNQLMVLILHK